MSCMKYEIHSAGSGQVRNSGKTNGGLGLVLLHISFSIFHISATISMNEGSCPC